MDGVRFLRVAKRRLPSAGTESISGLHRLRVETGIDFTKNFFKVRTFRFQTASGVFFHSPQAYFLRNAWKNCSLKAAYP
jgi:hypothetical protein